MALRGMADDGAGVPLSRRTPGAARRGPGKPVRPVLSDSQLNRMKAAIDAEHGQANQGMPDDPNTEPLPRVTVSPPSERAAKRPPSPSGVGPDSEVPDGAAKPDGVAGPSRSAGEQPRAEKQPRAEEPRAEEQPRAEEPLRVRKALRAVEPDVLRAAEQEASAPPPPPAESDDPAEPDDWPSGIKPDNAKEAAFAWDPAPTPGSIGWLWPEDTPRRGGGGRWRPPGRRGYRTAALAAAGAVVLGCAGAAVALSLHANAVAAASGKPTPKATARPTAAPTPTPSVTPTHTQDTELALSSATAATWITQQVAIGTYVACDANTCSALTASGFPAYQEVQIGVGSQSLANASMVVMTPELRRYFSVINPRLGKDVTPVTLASFGQVSIQAVDSAGAAAYQTALNQDVQERMQLGEQLLNSGRVSASPTAESELAAGQVDPRVLLALQALTDQQPIDVLGFADSGPGASPGVPFRVVALAGTDPASGLTARQYLQQMGQLLNAHADFPAYTKAEPVKVDGQPAVQIEYAAPSPLGLLTA